MTLASKHKSKFRQTSKWKNFRKYMGNKYKTDFITGKPLLSGWQLHHLNMKDQDYEKLNEDDFVCLNRTTHKVAHFFFRYSNWRDCIRRLFSVLEKMEKLN